MKKIKVEKKKKTTNIFENTKKTLFENPLRYIAILIVSPLILTSVITMIVYTPYFLKQSVAGKISQFSLLFVVELFVLTAIATFLSVMIINEAKLIMKKKY